MNRKQKKNCGQLDKYYSKIKEQNKLIIKDLYIFGGALVGTIVPFLVKSNDLFYVGLISSAVLSIKTYNISEKTIKKFKLYRDINKEAKIIDTNKVEQIESNDIKGKVYIKKCKKDL